MKREILKLDLADLDFGIYRILNYRRAEIEHFFDEELPALLDEALTHEGEARRAELEEKTAELGAELEKAAKDLGLSNAFADGGVRTELAAMPKAVAYADTRRALEALDDGEVFSGSEEGRLYNVLYTFFSRYYRDGDFQPQPRRARDARYSVPYNGEDVHFHWRSKGSHYIKTTEELKSYSFRSNEWRVRFELVEAFQEPDSAKGNSRYFIPVAGECRTEVTSEGNLFVVPFAFRRLTVAEERSYKKKSDNLEGDSIQERILNDLGETIEAPKGLTKNDLAYHLRRYARKNRTDYFVHPQLGAFLRDELDYYLKNEFLDIDGLTSTEAIADRLVKIRVLRAVAGRIISMLDEIESFQTKLFEKRKFVLSTSYLIPIRLIPPPLWGEILANDSQKQSWREEFGLKGRISRCTLNERPTLVVDTTHFPRQFWVQLLESMPDISDVLDGLLIKSENFAALRTIRRTFESTIGAIYLDPPYNTGNDGFLYLDEYSRDSSWIAMMESRLRIAFDFLDPSGVCFISVDDIEADNLAALLSAIKPLGSTVHRLVWKSRQKPDARNTNGLSVDHEYVFALMPENARLAGVPIDESKYSNPDNDPRGPWMSDNLTGLATADRRPNLHYPIVNPDTGDVYPPSPTRGWAYSQETMKRLIESGEILWPASPTGRPRKKRFLAQLMNRRTTFTSVLSGFHTTDGTRDIQRLFGSKAYLFPKPTAMISELLEQVANEETRLGTVLDFFAGSGTTAQSAIQLSREDGHRRRFILVDNTDSFDAVLKSRVVRTMYCPDWKNGLPAEEPSFVDSPPDWVERSPRLVQVLNLESYEDCLRGFSMSHDAQFAMPWDVRRAIPVAMGSSAHLLDSPRLESPFDYQVEVATESGVALSGVDLVTTFNLFRGILPKRYRELEHDGARYVVVEGSEGGETVLVVWRSVKDLDPDMERAFLETEIPAALGTKLADYAKIWHNADSALPNSESLDAEFKRLMFEPEPALA